MAIFDLSKNQIEIDPNLCVHSKILSPSCRECVEICPKSAWSLNENSLSFDEEICEGCLLCTSYCPESALSSNLNIKPINTKEAKSLFIACENSKIQNNELKIPCIHSIGLKELLKFYLLEVNTINITIGECKSCHNPQKTIFNSFDEVTKLVDLKLFNLNQNEWQKELDRAKSFHKTSLTRRNFLKRFTAKTVDTTLKATNLIDEDKFNFTLADIIPKLNLKTLPFIVNIDEEKCNGCDICFKLCPHRAIQIDMINSKYIIDSKFCTNCNLCVDMCKEEAIKIDKFTTQTINEIELIEKTCVDCGISFHTPKSFLNSSNKCQICQKTNHKDMLYQVI